jgi:subtilisin family serine protease
MASRYGGHPDNTARKGRSVEWAAKEGRPTSVMKTFTTYSGRSGLLATLVATALLAVAPAGANAAKSHVPTDRAFGAQWELVNDNAMGMRSAWNVATAGNVTVAVIDTGAQLDHPDLAANLWTNTKEIPGNGIDDDHNGFVDDVHGYNFVAKNGNPTDDNGHGTNVAGIIGARGNNKTGVAGVAWQAKLMIVKVLGADGTGNVYDVAAGIRYAVANGAKIINLSMAGPDDDPALEAAITQASDAGVLVVAAAGNSSSNLDTTPAYPASSPAANVISVASTDQDGALAGGSSYGAHTVDISAPGENIDSTETGSRYGVRSGTSQAAAHVTGVLALMAAAAPTASAQTLRTQLLAGARPTSVPVAGGALDAGNALRHVLGMPAARSLRASKRSARSAARAATRRSATRSAKRAPGLVSVA